MTRMIIRMPKLDQVRSLSEQHVQCRALVSPNPLWLADPSESAVDAGADMAAFGFDAAPVSPASSFRFVTARALADAQPDETTDSLSLPIQASIVLGAEAPLDDAIELLRNHPFFFIQRRREIVGIVTRADLSHAAVSAYAFQSLMAVESGLDSLIPSYAPRSVWLHEILGKDSKKILEVHATRQRFNADSTLFDAMMLRHRIEILEALPRLHQDVVTEETRDLFLRRGKEKETRPLDHLRNTLAHGGSILHAFSDPQEAIRILQMVEELAQQVWRLVDGREQLWRAYGMTILSWSLPTPTVLNGSQVAENLPLQWPIFGISACNPFDRELSEGLNDQRTQRLASAIAKRATNHWIGHGKAFDDTYSEPTVFAEGMDYNTALGIGARFGQRAIFQIDAETVSVIACRTGSLIRTWRRHWDDSAGPTIVAMHGTIH
jgi:CBS domain-containing protein